MDYPALTEEEKRKLIAQTPYLQHIIAKYGENAADDQRIVNEWAEEQWHRETGEPASTKITGQILAIIDEKVANYYATRHEIPTLTEALKALAKETKKPYALLKTNYEAGDQLTVGRVNDILGIKATSREIHKTEQPTNATSCETEAKQNTPTPEPTTKHSTNATSCEKKKGKAGRPQLGARPMTPAERMKLSRDRKRFPADGTQHSGKMISVMLSGEAHSALNDLLDKYGNLLQKEIIENAIIHYNRK